ncbi:helix-turn-helix transcriptional regulator [Streptomyces cahuitamycinicus]|uniref:AraC family transcriptional regulator n=1 Tax=Streptomyces cahuitamycinicus TaxID=2070367 RepID=A0A2N8TWX3_9ACTN|nr:helix-turn-helix transcriptional regulator [Streptomyces cahuitamycinicus]PNG23513.1 AraC family transcriptional regulator [Streptomyces cahuitamycinicus]
MNSTTTEHAIRKVVEYMRINLGNDLTIDDMARTAMFSKFHFTRIFKDATGISPGRFLSALRLQEAKRLLVRTDFSVADISSQVGYSSVGTFSSRFKECVGIPPSEFRDRRGIMREIPRAAAMASLSDVAQRRSLRGRVVRTPGSAPGPIFVGLFPSCVPQGRPVRFTGLEEPGVFELADVPPGSWYVLAHSAPDAALDRPDVAASDELYVGRHGPVTVHAGTLVMPLQIVLRPRDALDPPVLLALHDMRAEHPASV